MTDEGKEWNRKKSKEYYLRNKEKILEKRKAEYAPRKKTTAVSNSPDQGETA
jgi:hypothetical protein